MDADTFAALPAGAVQLKRYPKDSLVFRQGARTAGLYRVRSGAVAMHRSTSDGSRLVVRRAIAGELFAEASLFTSRYHCDAVCVEDSDIETVKKAVVLDAIATLPEFALAFCNTLAQAIHASRQVVELQAVPSAEHRVLMAIQLGLMTGTIAELAQQIGLTQSTCYRALSALAQSGDVIKTGRGQYQLP